MSMKIKKTKPQAEVKAAEATPVNKYVNATDHIESAIKVLGSIAISANDDVAREAIGNLSVILLDLKS